MEGPACVGEAQADKAQKNNIRRGRKIPDMDREKMSGVPLIMHHSIIAFWSGLVFLPVICVGM